MNLVHLALCFAGLCLATQKYVVIDGVAYLLPTEPLTAAKLLSDPFFADAKLDNLPVSFWKHTSRTELVKLIGRFGLKETLSQVQKSGLTEELVVDSANDLILYSEAVYSSEGVKFTTIFDEFVEKFDLNHIDVAFLGSFKSHIIPGLKLAPTLAQLNQETLFKLARFYFPMLETKVHDDRVSMALLLKQAVQRFMELLLSNEGVTAGTKAEMTTLVELMLSSHVNIYKGVLEDPLNPTFIPGSMRGALLEKLIVHKFRQIEDESPLDAFNYLMTNVYLKNGLVGKNMVPDLLNSLIDKHTLNILGDREWSMIASMYDHRPLTTIVLTGIMIGALNGTHTSDPEFFNKIVVREQYDQLIIGREVDLLAKPFVWISIAKPKVVLPTKIIRVLLEDHHSSVVAQECLLKHLAVDGFGIILPWFWKLVGSGAAKFTLANTAFKKMIIKANIELAYLAFPDEFEGNPPPTFKKSTLIDLISLGPVDGTRRHINAMMSKLVLMRLDVLTMEELTKVQSWAAESHLSYVMGTYHSMSLVIIHL